MNHHLFNKNQITSRTRNQLQITSRRSNQHQQQRAQLFHHHHHLLWKSTPHQPSFQAIHHHHTTRHSSVSDHHSQDFLLQVQVQVQCQCQCLVIQLDQCHICTLQSIMSCYTTLIISKETWFPLSSMVNSPLCYHLMSMEMFRTPPPFSSNPVAI